MMYGCQMKMNRAPGHSEYFQVSGFVGARF